MPLMSCPDCGAKVPGQTATCPACGRLLAFQPFPTPTPTATVVPRPAAWSVAVALAVGLLAAALGWLVLR